MGWDYFYSVEPTEGCCEGICGYIKFIRRNIPGHFSISGKAPKEVSFLIHLRQVPTTVSLIHASLISKALTLFITKLSSFICLHKEDRNKACGFISTPSD